jgi:hypothetical protein
VNAIYSTRWSVSLERLFLHRRGVREACFLYGNSFPLASVGYGKVAFPHGKLVSAQAWGTGIVLPVRELVPVGKRGLREGCLPARETCFCIGVGYGKHASRTGTHSRWQAWATGRLPSRTGSFFLHRRGVWEGHPVWGFKIIKQKGEGWAGVLLGDPRALYAGWCPKRGAPLPLATVGRRPPIRRRPPPLAAARRRPPSLHPPPAARRCRAPPPPAATARLRCFEVPSMTHKIMPQLVELYQF